MGGGLQDHRIFQEETTGHASAVEKLAARAYKLYDGKSVEAWKQLIRQKGMDHFEELVVPEFWGKRWYDFFPLYFHDKQNQEAAIVLNSVAPDPTLFGS